MKKEIFSLLSATLLFVAGAQAQSARAKTPERLSFERAFPAWLINANGVGDLSRLDAYGQPLSLPGNTALEKAQAFLNSRLREAGVIPEEWTVVSNTTTKNFTYLYFGRKIAGREALFSYLRFQFAKDGTLVRLQVAVPQAPAAGIVPQLPPDGVKEAAYGKPRMGEVIRNVVVSPNWVWMPETGKEGRSRLQLAYPFTADGISEDGQTPARFEGYISAVTGKLLLRRNRTHTGINLTVKGQKQSLRPTDPIDTVGFPDLEINRGTTTFYTDSSGFLAGPTIGVPATLTLPLQGRWSQVYDVASGSVTPSVTLSVSASGTTVIRMDSLNFQNAYYHVSRIHDFIAAELPTFTGMDTQLPTNVDDPSGSCNAYYNGSSINFYAASGGCQSMARFADIIYHEYGHGINERFYSQFGGGAMYNSALNEGYADTWAMLITKVPIMGEGATGPGGVIRRYDNVVKKFPVDIQGEPHADGEMIAGSWWHVAKYLGGADSMRPLFIESFYSLADGLEGDEPNVYQSVLVSALLADDNDNNLNNGTPHFRSIIRAFADHGIYLGAYTVVEHNELAHQPANMPINITGKLTTIQPPVFGGATVFFRPRAVLGGAWDSVQVTVSGSTFTAQIPAQVAGSVVDYYIRVANALAPEDLMYYPIGYRPELSAAEVTLPYQFGVGLKTVLVQDFESNPVGWQVGNVSTDDAFSGIWTWGVSTPSFQTSSWGGNFIPLIIQPDTNHTPGGSQCLFTDNNTEVQYGMTTVVSPPIDLTNLRTPVLEYYRWFSNNRGSYAHQNFWRTQIQSASGGMPFVIDNTRQADQSWRRRIIRVRDHILSSTISSVRLRFILNDQQFGQSSLEGAIDDVVLYDEQNPASTENVAFTQVRVYPNPATNVLTVEGSTTATGAVLGLYDLQGRLLLEKEVSGSSYRADFNTAQLASGSYFLRIKTDGVQHIKKVQVLR